MTKSMWIMGTTTMVLLSAINSRQLAAEDHQRAANSALLAWQAECPVPAEVAVAESGFWGLAPVAEVPAGPTASEQSAASRFLEGHGPRPDLPCAKRLLLPMKGLE